MAKQERIVMLIAESVNREKGILKNECIIYIAGGIGSFNAKVIYYSEEVIA